jgi:hypothetical protein
MVHRGTMEGIAAAVGLAVISYGRARASSSGRTPNFRAAPISTGTVPPHHTAVRTSFDCRTALRAHYLVSDASWSLELCHFTCMIRAGLMAGGALFVRRPGVVCPLWSARCAEWADAVEQIGGFGLGDRRILVMWSWYGIIWAAKECGEAR